MQYIVQQPVITSNKALCFFIRDLEFIHTDLFVNSSIAVFDGGLLSSPPHFDPCDPL